MAIIGFVKGKAVGSGINVNPRTCSRNCKSCSRYRCNLGSGINVISSRFRSIASNNSKCDRSDCYMCRYNSCDPKGSRLCVIGNRR